MGPVNHTTFIIPFVLAIEPDGVSFAQRIDSRCEINVMRNQDHISAADFDQETLVPAAFVVVRKKLDNLSVAGNLNIAAFTGDYLVKLGVLLRIDG